MPIPTEQEWIDAKEDLDDLEAIVNGSTTVTTRLGGDRDSVNQLLSRIVVGDVTAYSDEVTYTTIDQWVTQGGAMYRPLPESLPIGPEAFDSSKWSPVNGLDLANLTATINGVSRNPETFLDGQSVTDYSALIALSPSDYADGEVVNITDSGIAGSGNIRKVIGHGFTSTSGVIVRIDDDTYWEREVKDNTYDPIWFGADPTGVVDSAPAIQACLDLRPNQAGSYAPSKVSGGEGRVTVLMTEGDYLLASPLDMSQRDYTVLEGSGRVNLKPNHTSYCIDLSSSDHGRIQNIRISSGTAVIGIYMTRCTTNPFTQFNHIEDVEIVLGTSTTANGGLGTIGIYNCRSEQFQMTNVTLRTDSPYIARSTAGTLLPLFGTQDTSIISCSVNYYQQCNFIKNGPQEYCVSLAGCLEHEFAGCYWGAASLNTGPVTAACLFDGITSCKFTGSNEVNGTFADVRQDCYNNEVRIAQQLSVIDDQGIFNLDNTGARSGFLDGYVSIMVAGGTPAAGACIFKDSGTATPVTVTGNIIKTTQLMATIISAFSDGVSDRKFRHNIEQREGSLTISSALLRFAPTQIASSDPNTLDDYEEGTFTPVVFGLTTAGTATYSAQSGFYTKVGNVVHYNFFVNWSGHTGAGAMRISGLPFASSSATNNFSPCCIRSSDVTINANNIMVGYVEAGADTIQIEQTPVGGGTTNDVNIDAAGNLMVSGTYRV